MTANQPQRRIEVIDYDPNWPRIFEQLHARIWPSVSDIATSIEHVGSTSVPGLAAKPIIDMDIVVRSPDDVSLVIERLKPLGYVHRGNLGIHGREAFSQPEDLPAHHLYLCYQGSLGLRNHLAFRNYLRSHPDAAETYAQLKKQLARQHTYDIDQYVEGKSDLILSVLRQLGLSPDNLELIERANKAK